MKLEKIKKAIREYKKILADPDYEEWYIWELLEQYQEYWDMDAMSFSSMFDTAFSGKSKLWTDQDYQPKMVMSYLSQKYDDLIRSAFGDLYADHKDLAGRVDRFIYQLDQVYMIERRDDFPFASHYHEDRQMIFTYLAFHDPQQYAFYYFRPFAEFLRYVESPKPYPSHDIDRFYKVCKAIKTIALKDDELKTIIDEKLGEGYFEKAPMIVVGEVYRLVSFYT